MEKDSPAASGSPGALDVPTVASISVVAYSLTNLIHEGLGHGGACLLVGGKPAMLNAVFFQAVAESITTHTAGRILTAGGSVANVIFALLAWAALRAVRKPGALNYFLWQMLALNILMPFAYLLFSGLMGMGDWAVFVEGLGSPLVFRGILSVLGAFLYFYICPKIIIPDLNPYLGSEPKERGNRANKLCLLPYIVGGVTYVAAGLLNPMSMQFVLTSAAAASFGGTSLLAWYPGRVDDSFRAKAPAVPSGIERSWPWIVAALVMLGVFVGVLGPGIKLGS